MRPNDTWLPKLGPRLESTLFFFLLPFYHLFSRGRHRQAEIPWSLYKCAVLWWAAYGAAATESLLGTTIRKVKEISSRVEGSPGHFIHVRCCGVLSTVPLQLKVSLELLFVK